MAGLLSVVIVESDYSIREGLKKQLEKIKEIELASEAEGLDEANNTVQSMRPDILILRLPKDSEETLKWMQRVKLEFPEVTIFVSSKSKAPELIISAMRAGAQEFLGRPIDPNELKEAVDKVQKIKEQKRAHIPESGRIISVFSKKGGLGVTTIAVNLGVALSQVTKRNAALIDLDIQLGDITSFLNLTPEYNILDACNSNEGVDGVKLQSCLTRHKSGVFVLAEPQDPVISDNISPSQINQILENLRATFPYVIVDTTHMFDSKTKEAFELSDHIIVITAPNIPSLRATKKTLRVFKELGYGPDKVKIVVNRISKRDQIKPDAIRKTLNYPVSWFIPNNYKAVIEAMDSGVPLVDGKGKSDVAKSIMDLAKDITKWSRSYFLEVEETD